jgi:hypothetical protein
MTRAIGVNVIRDRQQLIPHRRRGIRFGSSSGMVCRRGEKHPRQDQVPPAVAAVLVHGRSGGFVGRGSRRCAPNRPVARPGFGISVGDRRALAFSLRRNLTAVPLVNQSVDFLSHASITCAGADDHIAGRASPDELEIMSYSRPRGEQKHIDLGSCRTSCVLVS